MPIRMLLRTLTRRRTTTLLTAVIALFCTLFLCIYTDIQRSLPQQLDAMTAEIPVTARITNKAGTLTSMLEIRSEMLDKLHAVGLSETAFATLDVLTMDGNQELKTMDKKTNREEWGGFTSMTIANELALVVADPAGQITFASGYTAESLVGDKPYCLLSKTIAADKGLSLGDSYPVTVYRVFNEGGTAKARRVGYIELTVVGIIDATNSSQDNALLSGYMSDGLARRLFDENNAPYYYQSAGLRVTDPMQLNVWKAKAREVGFSPVDITEDPKSTRGVGLTVYDEVFVNAVTPIVQSMNIFASLYLVIFGIILFIGGIVSYLLINQRRGEIAICRTLGMRKSALFITLMVETFIPCAAGVAIGLLVLLPFVPPTMATFSSLGGFVTCYMLGCAAAILLINRDNVIRAMTAQ